MIITAARFRKQKYTAPKKGFTLVEVLISVSILSLVLGGVFTSFFFILRSSVAIGNYADMSMSGRYFLENLGREVRMASDVVSLSTTSFKIEVTTASGTEQIEYIYQPSSQTITREDSNGLRVVLSDVVSTDFKYFNVTATETTAILEAKAIQVKVLLQKEVTRLKNTDRIISARFIMRNRQVTS